MKKQSTADELAQAITKPKRSASNKKNGNGFWDKFVPCTVFVGVVLLLDYLALTMLFSRTNAEFITFVAGMAAVVIGGLQIYSIVKIVSGVTKK